MWKERLLSLVVPPPTDPPTTPPLSILLSYSSHPRFTQKCVENDLPPNLLHCLRLLRVIEMQNPQPPPQEMSTVEATGLISNLLSTVCSDTSVGEMMR